MQLEKRVQALEALTGANSRVSGLRVYRYLEPHLSSTPRLTLSAWQSWKRE